MVARLKMSQKKFFFDRARVQRAKDRATIRGLSKYGAFVRRDARKSIKKRVATARDRRLLLTGTKREKDLARKRIERKRRATSKPGEPPFSHVRDDKQSIRNIWFAYDPRNESVVVGPIKFNAKGKNVPAVLEHGGSAVITFVKNGRFVQRRVRIAARPFMRPAGIKNLPKFKQFMKDSIRR